MKKASFVLLVLTLVFLNIYTFLSGQGNITFTINQVEYSMPAPSFFFCLVLMGYLFNLIYNAIFNSKTLSN